MYDVIIIGAGPAGVSASLYTRKSQFENLNFIPKRRSFGENQ